MRSNRLSYLATIQPAAFAEEAEFCRLTLRLSSLAPSLNQTYIATQPNRDAARAGRQAVADARNHFLATGLNAIVGLESPLGIRFE